MNRHEPPTLEKRIVAALGNPNNGSEALIELIQETEIAATTAEQAAIDEHAKALDLVASPDAGQAHERIIAAEMTRDRLKTNLPKLHDKLSVALMAESRERWFADYRRVRQNRDDAATLFKSYPEHAEAIARMFALAEHVDREVSRVNGSAPDGVSQRLRSVELEARNLDRFTRDNPSLSQTVQLRDWNSSGKSLWPLTSSGSLAAAYAGSMVAPAHPGPRWADNDIRQERCKEVGKEKQRLGEFYKEQTAAQEERQNAEERLRFASRS